MAAPRRGTSIQSPSSAMSLAASSPLNTLAARVGPPQ